MKREGRRVRKQGEIIVRTLTTLSLLTNLSLLLFFFLFAEGLSTVKRPLVALVFCVLLFLFFALLFCSGRNITKNGRSKRNRRGTRRSEEHTSELQSLMRISYAVFCLKKQTETLS